MVDEEDEGEDVRTVKKQSEMLFVRGEMACIHKEYGRGADSGFRRLCRAHLAAAMTN